mmetsp:Transcript_89190/g.247691  ORF Transcript_89190/g.247691 Transcript_89190/m.247691 type:complete len:267 (+) Transcript_89190:247-1047(+)
MPTNGHTAILIKVQVAGVWPSRLLREAAIWHGQLQKLCHPGWKHLGFNLDVAVAVRAAAATGHHPSSLPWNRPKHPLGLLPLGAGEDLFKERIALFLGEGALQEACVGTARLVPQRVTPAHASWQRLAGLPNHFQANCHPRLLPECLREPLRLCIHHVWSATLPGSSLPAALASVEEAPGETTLRQDLLGHRAARGDLDQRLVHVDAGALHSARGHRLPPLDRPAGLRSAARGAGAEALLAGLLGSDVHSPLAHLVKAWLFPQPCL